ncbi:redoxin family protein [Sphingomonas sp. HDW15A]|uniref:redoxin family protein n=1 Tax=Sphingomonas sp. HDW15A TaxID=2714942 RepID=UPI00140C44FC|nr:redoxin family protein [Sphingomonas sp. HDW15A]QIK96021.1 redoxin family protein [Sphingomonas sp. HDW15A]
MRGRLILATPLLLLAVFAGVALWRLSSPPDTVIRSRLEGQKLPQFALPAAIPGRATVKSAGFADGQPKLLNIFASWCVPCVAEAPILLELERRGVRIEAIAVRDRPADVAAFLERHGDPFLGIGSDLDSKVQMSLGSSGVPESFILDGRGVIRYQHVGPIMPQDMAKILGEMEEAR